MRSANGRVVLVTGASSGIGRACATHLHQRGYRVYGASRRTPEAGSVPSDSFEMIHMDVNEDLSVQRGIEHILKNEGRLDVAVNNAGYSLAGAVEDTSIEEAKAQFETNFFGVLRVCRAVLPVMREQRGGHIVTIGSLAGRFGMPFQGLYSASKFALEGLTEALRLEVRGFGIKVALVAPGDVNTSLTLNRRRALGSQNDSAYAKDFDTALRIMESDERNGADPNSIAHLVERIIENPSPRVRYASGPLFQRVAIVLKKIVPFRFFEWAVVKYYKLTK